jgi:hypothetical protein
MEGLSAAQAIVQFIDVASKIVKRGVEFHRSPDGQLAEHRELKNVTADLAHHADVLKGVVGSGNNGRRLPGHEVAQRDIGRECQEVAAELLRVLDKLADAGRKSQAPWKSFRQAMVALREDKKIQSLEKRLDRLRQEMVVIILNSLR